MTLFETEVDEIFQLFKKIYVRILKQFLSLYLLSRDEIDLNIFFLTLKFFCFG
jgi:hypothetical protein